MTQIKSTVPSLFQKKIDLILIALCVFLFFSVLRNNGDSLEHKFVQLYVVLVGCTAVKGLSIISQVYYPSVQEKSFSPSLIVFTLLNVLNAGAMSAILTWNAGEDLKDHLYDSFMFGSMLFVVVLVASIFSKR